MYTYIHIYYTHTHTHTHTHTLNWEKKNWLNPDPLPLKQTNHFKHCKPIESVMNSWMSELWGKSVTPSIPLNKHAVAIIFLKPVNKSLFGWKCLEKIWLFLKRCMHPTHALAMTSFCWSEDVPVPTSHSRFDRLLVSVPTSQGPKQKQDRGSKTNTAQTTEHQSPS